MKKHLGIAALVASLSAPASCGDEPDNYYIVGGEEAETSCYTACERLLDCDPKEGHTAEECVSECKKYDFATKAPEWFDCIMDEICNERLRGVCDDYLSEINKEQY